MLRVRSLRSPAAAFAAAFAAMSAVAAHPLDGLLARHSFQGMAASAPHRRDDAVNATPHLTYHTWKQYDTNQYPWHSNISTLWETQWSTYSQHGIYPFDAWSNGTDFSTIFATLIAKNGSVSANGFPQDQWAAPFLEQGKKVLADAEASVQSGNLTAAYTNYFRAATVFRIGYFPWVAPNSESKSKKEAFQLEKQSYELGVKYYTPTIAFETVDIPFPTAPDGAYNKTIQGYIHANRNWTDQGDAKQKFVLLVGGLDHYRPGQWDNVQDLLGANFTALVIDMPGTGDAPISGKNSTWDAELWKTVLDWVSANADKYAIDTNFLYGWGTSTGSYYAIKLSRAEHARLKGVLTQGQAAHFAFKPDWLSSADYLAYPVDLWGPLASAWGYSYETKEDFAKVSSNYSLLSLGVLDSESCLTTVVNGLDDGVFPIDDALLATTHAAGSFARLFPGQGHMGEPASGAWVTQFWKDVQKYGFIFPLN